MYKSLLRQMKRGKVRVVVLDKERNLFYLERKTKKGWVRI